MGKFVRTVPKEAKLNAAAARQPMSGKQDRPAASKTGSHVGNETKADMRGALEGQPTDKNPLHGAVRELQAQHPIKYDDLGPHRGHSEHLRHKPFKIS